jgi:adenine-specific DNA-methyltransferase
MDGKSLDITEERLNKLKEILPDAFTEGKIDWEKLQASLGENIEFKNERYVLNWAGKSDAFRVLQSPTTATLVPCKEESVGFDDTENIFIEGENLEVLKVLQKSYFGKIKMIYIDPPYNTGNDKFIYPDKFSESRDEYLNRIGDKDETGYMTREGLFRTNSKDSGHYHSNWLSMMYPRLFLARNLLREDGVIFVSIDDNEVHNLKLMMNEVFGEENFISKLIWKRRASSALSDNNVSVDHEYVICHKKGLFLEFKGNEKDFNNYKNPDNDPRGDWVLGDLTVGMTASMRPNQAYDLVNPKTGKTYPFNPNRVWAYIPSSMKKLIDENRVYFPDDSSKRPMLKRFKNKLKDDFNPFSSLMDDVGLNTEATKQIQQILDGNIFDYSKPLSLLKTLIPQISNDNADILLDFFAGSATAAHAVLELNKEDGRKRKFIMVQLPEKCDEKSEAFKVGYKTIADIGKERIRRVIKKIKEDKQTKLDVDGNARNQDLGFKVFKLQESNFKIWRSDVKTEEQLYKQLTLHTDPVDENAKIENILYELLLKSGVPLTARIEEKDGYYRVNNGEIILILKRIDEGIIKSVISEKPKKLITLDRLFKNNDQLKTNTALQLKDAEIDFRVV